MSVSIEDMKAELEANDYSIGTFSTLVYKGDLTWDTVHNDDGLTAVEQAYAHLQDQRELMALRAFVLADAKEYESIGGNAFVKGEAQELIEQYNITAENEG